MNLSETIQALEAKNIAIAINLGTHQHCAIDSNCPLAVELRRIMVDAGVTLEQLLEGYTAVTAADPVSYNLPEIDGKVAITIAGTTVELDLSDIASTELRTAMTRKDGELREREVSIHRLGNSLYHSYLRAIAQARESPILPQLSFSRTALMKANCHITCDGNSYIFLFPTEYKPEYMVHCSEYRTGVITRYKIADEDIETLKEEVWLQLVVRGDRFLHAQLVKRTGRGLLHYHGDEDGDCWGNVRIPPSWDGTLESLCELKTLIMNSLATINTTSLMHHHPLGKLPFQEVLDRCTRIGIEGAIPPQPRDTAGRFAAREEAPRTGWGTRARTGGTTAATRTEPEEYARRWGVGTFREAENLEGERAICTVCHQHFAEHNGYTCPRDFHLRR